MAAPRLIICGSIALDRIMNFTGKYRDLIKPDKLHALSLSVLLDEVKETPGGSGANIAYGSAVLGDHPVLLNAVGSDASDYLNVLAEAGVDTSHVHVSDLPTASFNVMTDSEDSQIGGFYPGAMSDSSGQSLESWAGQDVLICVSPHDPAAMRAHVEECRQYKLRMVYDPGQQVSNTVGADLQAGINAAEILIVNDYEMSLLCEKTDSSADELKANLPIVITTFGKDGSAIEGKNVESPIKIPAVTTVQALDPTGAGDAYRAGFLYGYLRQWPLQDCGQLGAVVASFVVEEHGTQVQFSKKDIIKRYQEAFKKEVIL